LQQLQQFSLYIVALLTEKDLRDNATEIIDVMEFDMKLSEEESSIVVEILCDAFDIKLKK